MKVGLFEIDQSIYFTLAKPALEINDFTKVQPIGVLSGSNPPGRGEMANLHPDVSEPSKARCLGPHIKHTSDS